MRNVYLVTCEGPSETNYTYRDWFCKGMWQAAGHSYCHQNFPIHYYNCSAFQKWKIYQVKVGRQMPGYNRRLTSVVMRVSCKLIYSGAGSSYLIESFPSDRFQGIKPFFLRKVLISVKGWNGGAGFSLQISWDHSFWIAAFRFLHFNFASICCKFVLYFTFENTFCSTTW